MLDSVNNATLPALVYPVPKREANIDMESLSPYYNWNTSGTCRLISHLWSARVTIGTLYYIIFDHLHHLTNGYAKEPSRNECPK